MDFTFTTRYIHSWVSFLRWSRHFILSGAISNCPLLFPRSILEPSDLGEFIFHCHIFSPFHTVHGVLTTRKLEWFNIPSSSRLILSEVSSMTCPFWVALHGMAHSFIELHKLFCHNKDVIHECSNNNTMAFISHASKVMLKTLQAKLSSTWTKNLTGVQDRFRKGRGTRGQIANICWITEKAREFQKHIYFCFTDFAKAFDYVQFSCSLMSDSLRPHELHHARPPYPSPTARVYPNPCPLSQWCHPNISSSVVPFSSCPQSLPSLGLFKWVLPIRWPKYWNCSFSISPSNEHPGLISFRMDWLDLLAVQGTLKSLLQHHSSKASILPHSTFFVVQLSHPYLTTGKTTALTRQTFVDKVMSLPFNMLSRLVITFLP